METREILTRFKNGELSIEEAEHYFRKEPFEVMDDYAKLDSHREIRNGFPEVIFCSGKLISILSISLRSCMRIMVKCLEREHRDISMNL